MAFRTIIRIFRYRKKQIKVMEKLEKVLSAVAIGIGIGIVSLVAAVAILRVAFELANFIDK